MTGSTPKRRPSVGGDVSQLDELVANLRRLDAAGVEIATTALPEVLADAKATAAAGASPEGQAWTPTKEGRPALPNAASAITAPAEKPPMAMRWMSTP